MNAENARKLRNLLLIAGVVLIFASNDHVPLLICGFLVACSGIVPDYLFNKCPHCGRHLGQYVGKYCQHCGKPLEE